MAAPARKRKMSGATSRRRAHGGTLARCSGDRRGANTHPELETGHSDRHPSGDAGEFRDALRRDGRADRRTSVFRPVRDRARAEHRADAGMDGLLHGGGVSPGSAAGDGPVRQPLADALSNWTPVPQRPKSRTSPPGSRARAAGVFSWIANRFSLAGAGLIAETSARQHILWDDVATAHFHPLWRTVSLSNGWHVVLILFCSPGNYDAVAAAVHTGLAARHPHSFHNPLPGLLFRTFLVLLSCMPLFAMPYVEKDGVFPALVILGFGLASVWLMPSLAWVVLAALGWAAVLEVLAQVKLRDSLFGGTFRAYQVLNMGEAITLGLTIAGMACLAALSIGLLAGRVRTGLAGDRIERDMRR